MKWFKVFVSTDMIIVPDLTIKDLILEEFNASVSEITGGDDRCHFTLASNSSHDHSYLDEDTILIIGDISLHNKEELIKQNNLGKSIHVDFADELLSDELLCSRLYKVKGISFIQDLVGEFCFVLYDRSKKKSYFVRDQMGVKTLFWCKTNNGYFVTSDIFLIRKEMGIENINYEYFRDYYTSNGIIDTQSTPFQNVTRVPSGCYVEIGETSVANHQYWDLASIKEVIIHKDEDVYLDEFRELLYASVKSRLVKGNTNSVMLSGGMDSTSIYALTKVAEKSNSGYNITPISAVFNELQECDESYYISGLLEKYQDKGIYLNCDNVLLFNEYPNNIPFSYEPNVNAISFNFTYATVKKSIEHGLSNILSGYGGDQLLTGSLYMTRDLLKRFQIKEVLSYITDYSISTNSSALKNLNMYTLFPDVIKSYDLNEESKSYKLLYQKFKNIKFYDQKQLYYEICNAKSHLYTDRLIGALAGADISHPFLDRRLVEYIYKIPGKFRHSKQYGKYILRKSMKDYLTNDILERVNKTSHITHTYRSIRKNWGSIHKMLYNPLVIARLKLITVEEWRNELIKWRNGLQVKDSFWTLLAIELWFNGYNQKLTNN